ncbi:MAG TPA: hypothetical protein VHO46_01350 [Bacteroidales bacterium]|nr:hypothetical protein [Bacteroidales bacterium]
MAKSSVKPKAAAIWHEQTEKLKKKLSSFAERDLYLENEKMEELLQNFKNKVHHELYRL